MADLFLGTKMGRGSATPSRDKYVELEKRI
jgi:hypothetical protein